MVKNWIVERKRNPKTPVTKNYPSIYFYTPSIKTLCSYLSIDFVYAIWIQLDFVEFMRWEKWS